MLWPIKKEAHTIPERLGAIDGIGTLKRLGCSSISCVTQVAEGIANACSELLV